MHYRVTRWMAAGLLILFSLAVAACEAGTTVPSVIADGYHDVTDVDEAGNTAIDEDALDSALGEISATTLSDAESDGLLYMREEEKLARDVYTFLYDQWGLRIFHNIASSEQTHTDAVKALLDRYGLQDPAAKAEAGVFVNPTLQGLYEQLVAAGSESLGEALRVGAVIEEIDLIDLEERLAQTDKADIQMVYENLMKGSRNHLRSFVSTLERTTGATYEPQYLVQDTYDDIVSSQMERGRRGR